MSIRQNKKITRKKIIILLVIIIFIGCFLRIYNLDKMGLWYDEQIILMAASNHELSSVIVDLLEITEKAPLYPSFIHFWIRFYSSNDFMLRSTNVIFGVLSLFLIFKIGKILLDNKTGLMSSFIFSISVLHVTFSQEATEYSLLILLSLCSVFFLLKILQSKDPINYLGYVFVTIMLVYTHYFGWFLIIFQNIFMFGLWKKYRNFIKSWIIIQLFILISFAPLLLSISDSNWSIRPMSYSRIISDSNWNVQLMSYSRIVSVSLSPTHCSISDIFYTFSSSGFLVKNRIYEMSYSKDAYNFINNHNLVDLYYLGTPQFFLFVIFITLASFGMYSLIKSKNVNVKFKLFLLLWLLTPIIIKLFIKNANPCDIRYYLLSLPPFLIFVSNGIVSIKKKFWRIIVILLIISISTLVYYNYYNIYSEVSFVGPYWQLGQFIPENATNKEIAEYISFNSEPNLFPYIKIQKDAFEYINKKHPNAIILTDWVTSFKLSSPMHGWVKEPLKTLNTNLNIEEIGSNEFDLILKITGDGFDYMKGDLVYKALNKFDASLIKRWQYYNMSVKIYKNNEK